jgi:hypothetical protein
VLELDRLSVDVQMILLAEPDEVPALDPDVVEHGTRPVDGIFQELTNEARNLGITDIDALIARAPQSADQNPTGAYEWYRIDDCVTSRNIPVAIRSTRLMKMVRLSDGASLGQRRARSAARAAMSVQFPWRNATARARLVVPFRSQQREAKPHDRLLVLERRRRRRGRARRIR